MQGGSAYASEQGLDNAGMLTQGIGGPNVGGPNVGGPNVGSPIVSHGCGPNVVPLWSQWWEQCMGEGRASEPGLVTSQWT